MNDKSFFGGTPRLNRPSRGTEMSAPNQVRAYRGSPETVTLQIRLENSYVTVELPFDQATALGQHLIEESR